MESRSDTRGRDRRLAALATRQRGLVLRSQLLRLGVGSSGIDDWVWRGRLHPIHPGVYAVGHRALPPDAAALAAVLSAGPGAVLSHRSAAALWELRPSAMTRVEISTPVTTGRRSRAGILLHRSRTLTPDRVTRHHGIPVTTVARTLVDLAEVVPARVLERAADQAETIRRFDLAAIHAVIDANPGRLGCRRVARLLETHAIGTTLTRTELEELMLAICARAGLPRPEVNRRIAGVEVDFVWRPQRLVAEADSRRYHATRRAFERDRERDATLMLAGYRVVRFTDRRLTTDAAGVADVLTGLLAQPMSPRLAGGESK